MSAIGIAEWHYLSTGLAGTLDARPCLGDVRFDDAMMIKRPLHRPPEFSILAAVEGHGGLWTPPNQPPRVRGFSLRAPQPTPQPPQRPRRRLGSSLVRLVVRLDQLLSHYNRARGLLLLLEMRDQSLQEIHEVPAHLFGRRRVGVQ